MKTINHKGKTTTAAITVVATLAVLVSARLAQAAPQAHLLRIEPRGPMAEPVLTTVIDLVNVKRLSSVSAQCAALTGDAQLGCLADGLLKPQAQYVPYQFPEKMPC